ncbi:putative oxidoreductase [Murinocardiopsis flavida]|uniref:Putative oxidoreductase n=1 Tax=Murinocardiopsis flavida TaxID=645275 RepID=A0A2P8DHY7_9ACTN|nr:DoxX family protein [Murinocardiopsis flavida]PSK96799.1 putative oxidoreductase [Murinocardiopsis flavida]
MFAPTTTMRRAADATALIARIAVGIVFIVHGWQKISGGVAGTAEGFGAMGVPMPAAAAALAMVIEFGGGIALVIGALLPVAGVLLAAQMAAAYTVAHVGQPLVSADGGPAFELVLVLGAAALALGFNGGRYAVDRLLPWGRPRAAQEADAAAGSAAR